MIEDLKQKEYTHLGFNCVIRQNGHLGIWCGYVGIPKSHPAYNLTVDEYNDLLDVHGGITWADNRHPITRVEDGLYWIGLDCGHAGDIIPGITKLIGTVLPGETYKDQNYVEQEINKLAEQLKQIQVAEEFKEETHRDMADAFAYCLKLLYGEK